MSESMGEPPREANEVVLARVTVVVTVVKGTEPARSTPFGIAPGYEYVCVRDAEPVSAEAFGPVGILSVLDEGYFEDPDPDALLIEAVGGGLRALADQPSVEELRYGAELLTPDMAIRALRGAALCESSEDRARSLSRIADSLARSVADSGDLRHQLMSPPPGWFTLGSHIDPETGERLDIELEFWGDDGGTPFWERPKLAPSSIPDEREALAKRLASDLAWFGSWEVYLPTADWIIAHADSTKVSACDECGGEGDAHSLSCSVWHWNAEKRPHPKGGDES